VVGGLIRFAADLWTKRVRRWRVTASMRVPSSPSSLRSARFLNPERCCLRDMARLILNTKALFRRETVSNELT